MLRELADERRANQIGGRVEPFLDVLTLERAVLLEHVPAEPPERDRRAERDRVTSGSRSRRLGRSQC